MANLYNKINDKYEFNNTIYNYTKYTKDLEENYSKPISKPISQDQCIKLREYLLSIGTIMPKSNEYPNVSPTAEQVESWRNSTEQALKDSHKASLVWLNNMDKK